MEFTMDCFQNEYLPAGSDLMHAIVTVTAQGNMTYYSLRRDRAEEAGPELRAFISH